MILLSPVVIFCVENFGNAPKVTEDGDKRQVYITEQKLQDQLCTFVVFVGGCFHKISGKLLFYDITNLEGNYFWNEIRISTQSKSNIILYRHQVFELI